MRTLVSLVTAALLLAPESAFAAIGCTLSNPAQDLKYLFPEMASYREDLKEFPKLKDGAALFKGLRARLGSDLDPIYEIYETPYTVYSVFKGKQKIGVVHGVNVPGKGGVIQVFLSTDPESAAIRRLFFQRLESPAARALRDKDFRATFEGLTLADFYMHDYYVVAGPASEKDKIARIQPPKMDTDGLQDYAAALRGIRKNLILLDIFVYGQRFEPFFERARRATTQGAPPKE